ncbi:MAG: aminoacyl-tRNA hydrolase [Bacteroidales bacterium]|nr:aminoacyl-tRNA hydrolase [Bacteroidales bacterium]
MTSIRNRQLEDECEIKAIQSSGPGGQHVNKSNTKIQLRFPIGPSRKLNDEEKEKIREKLQSMVTQSDELLITSQDSRSQLLNREDALDKFYTLIDKALTPAKKRKKTKPPRKVKEKRLEEKKQQSEKKNLRKPPEDTKS